jgi:hypothetical protein
MPARDELILDGSGDPILSTATVAATFNMPSSSKPSGPGIIYSPEYKAQKLANANPITKLVKPSVSTGGISIAVADAAKKAQMFKLLTSGVVTSEMADGFREMGANFNDWNSIKKYYGMTDKQLDTLKAIHANFFGISTEPVTPLTPAEATTGNATKKPNYLLWAAIAVGGFFIVRKFLK